MFHVYTQGDEQDLGTFDGGTPCVGEVIELDGQGGRSCWYEVVSRSWRLVPLRSGPYACAFVFVRATDRRHP